MKAKSIKGRSIEEIQTALRESTADGFSPCLAMVFCSPRQDRDAIRSMFNKQDIAIYGATTAGEIIDDEILEGSVAALLVEFNPEYFYVDFAELNGHDDFEIAKDIAERAKRKFEQPAFLMACSNVATDAELLVRGIQQGTSSEIQVFGAMAGDDFTFTDQYVFTNERESNRGVVMVVLDESSIEVKGMAISGWQPVGIEKMVTKSVDGWVHEIDGKPALDVVAKYLGLSEVDQAHAKSVILEMGVNHPFMFQRDNGDFVLRGGLVVDWQNRSFKCSGNVPQGSRFRFSLPADFNVIDSVIQGYEELKATEMPEADALIMYSCLGRQMIFGPLMSKEIKGVYNVWNVPMAGFFCNGEIGRSRGGNLEHHAGTTVCAVLREKAAE